MSNNIDKYSSCIKNKKGEKEAYIECNYFQSNNQVQIMELCAAKKAYYSELLSGAIDFAISKGASIIVCYPDVPDYTDKEPVLSTEDKIEALYDAEFLLDGYLYGVVPIMVRSL